MTKEARLEIKSVSVGVIILMLFSFGAWLNNVKADKSELIPIKEQVKEVCSEQKDQRELYHRLDRTLGRIETILESWEEK